MMDRTMANMKKNNVNAIWFDIQKERRWNGQREWNEKWNIGAATMYVDRDECTQDEIEWFKILFQWRPHQSNFNINAWCTNEPYGTLNKCHLCLSLDIPWSHPFAFEHSIKSAINNISLSILRTDHCSRWTVIFWSGPDICVTKFEAAEHGLILLRRVRCELNFRYVVKNALSFSNGKL